MGGRGGAQQLEAGYGRATGAGAGAITGVLAEAARRHQAEVAAPK